MGRDTDSLKIARIEEKVSSMSAWSNKHETHDDERFTRTFDFMKDQFDKQNNVLKEINDKVGTLWDTGNRQEGALGISKFVAGGIGGILVAAIDWWVKK